MSLPSASRALSDEDRSNGAGPCFGRLDELTTVHLVVVVAKTSDFPECDLR